MLKSEYLLRSEYFKILYPEGLDLNNSFISNIDFSYDGPSLTISVHCNKLPLNKPIKWDLEDNFILIKIEFINIKDLLFNKWGLKNVINFDLKIVNDNYLIEIKGNEINLNFSCDFICINSISSYFGEY